MEFRAMIRGNLPLNERTGERSCMEESSGGDFFQANNGADNEAGGAATSGVATSGLASLAYSQQQMELDLNRHLIEHPAATFFMRVEGHALREWGLIEGDLLIVDRSLQPRSGDIAVVQMEGQLCLRKLRLEAGVWILESAVSPVRGSRAKEFELWGVVCHAIHHLRRPGGSR